MARDLFLLRASRPAPGHNQHPVQWVPVGSFPGVKWPGCKSNHSLPTIAEVKNEWSYNFTSHICLMEFTKKSLILIYYYNYYYYYYYLGINSA
jgi:hypothetical protein